MPNEEADGSRKLATAVTLRILALEVFLNIYDYPTPQEVERANLFARLLIAGGEQEEEPIKH
jgi:hypothetical protein